MYALVDCNNFYCSCERVFDPTLERRPIVVLSNNDGCIISRSEEAKKLGIVMGTPVFMMLEQLERQKVAVFSSNYTLYGDMSDRVMKTLSSFVPSLEVYSIDEAFLDLRGFPPGKLHELGLALRKTIRQHTGIPVTIGIAATKTLAKMANRFAKKKHLLGGLFCATGQAALNEMLAFTQAGDIWGVGHQYALLLNRHQFRTAADIVQAPEDWIRDKMSVVGLRMLHELKGIPSFELETVTPGKNNICTSRAFGTTLTNKSEIAEALVNHAATCARKLRDQKSCCQALEIFLQTNPHKTGEQQFRASIRVDLARASNHSAELIKYALKGFDLIYQEGYQFMKTGVTVMDLVAENEIQTSLFDGADHRRDKRLMDAMDTINRSIGKEIVRAAVQGYEKKYRTRADHLSPRYTTRITDIIKVKI